MPGFRDIKREGRRDVHRELQVPALYIAAPGATPVGVTVRVHTKFDALGNQKGTNFHSAEMIERQPQIVFMRSEGVVPARNAIVSVEPGEAYRIGPVSPPDDITITAIVTALTAAEAAGLPVPEIF